MNPFKKRIYSPLMFARDMGYLARNVRLLGPLLKGEQVSKAFRERLMLVVTAVNQCRYCAAAHGALGRRAGLSDENVQELLAGSVDLGPEEERVALQYAKEWAEADGRPDSATRATLVNSYGEQKSALIEFVLRAIRVGNLTGNSLDAVLNKLSAGRLASR